MKKQLSLLTLTICSFLSADQYSREYSGMNPYNQNPQYSNDNSWQQSSYQGSPSMQMQGQPYYQDSSAMQMRGQPNQYNQGQYSQGRPQQYSMDQYNSGYQQMDTNQRYPNGYSENPNMVRRPANMQNNQANVSDQELSKKVKDKIGSGWFSKGYENVYFDVYNGNVTLKGSVETQEDKNKVVEAVRKLDGVRNVVDQISIMGKKTAYNYGQIASTESKMKEYSMKFPNDKAATDADKVLNERIRDKLNGGWFSNGYTSIIIDSSNGVVTVSGIVDNLDDIETITKDIQKVQGVTRVVNRLTARNK